jgi:hypothetical protein
MRKTEIDRAFLILRSERSECLEGRGKRAEDVTSPMTTLGSHPGLDPG